MREKSASDRPGRHRRQPKLTDRTYLYHYRTVHLIRHTIETHLMGRPGINLLDVGCGSKPYEPLFRSAVERYIGCDIVPGPFVDVVCQAEALSVAANSVDVVASFSVLEHVEDPSRVCRVFMSITLPLPTTGGGHRQASPDCLGSLRFKRSR